MTSPFPLPIGFTSQAFKKNADGTPEDKDAVANTVRRARLMGARSIGVQINSGYPGEVSPAEVKALQDAGFFVVAWGVAHADPGTTARLLAPRQDGTPGLGVNGWLPQVEGPGQLDLLVNALKAGVGTVAPALPRAVVSTYGGLDTTAAVGRLRTAGIEKCFVECYAADGPPHDDVPRMVSQGYAYGFATGTVWPVVGTYRGETASRYNLSTVGRSFGVYLLEPTSDDALRSFGAVPDVAPPPPAPAPLPDPAALNSQISKLAHTWLDPQLPEQKSLSRLRSIARIAETTDPEWVAVRQAEVDALDGKGVVSRADYDALRAALDAANANVAELVLAKKDLAARLANETDHANALLSKIENAKAALA